MKKRTPKPLENLQKLVGVITNHTPSKELKQPKITPPKSELEKRWKVKTR